MSAILAAADNNFAQFGLVVMGLLTVGFIVNVSALHSKDLHRKSSHATSLLIVALLIETAVWTVRSFHGGSEAGGFWGIVVGGCVHGISAVLGLMAISEHRVVGRWPHGRRRSSWGFLLNVIALIVLAVWFWLGANPKVYERIFR